MSAATAVAVCAAGMNALTGKNLAIRRNRKFFASVDNVFCANSEQPPLVHQKNRSNPHFFNRLTPLYSGAEFFQY